MDSDFLIKFFGGIACILFGIWIFIDVRKTPKSHVFSLGSNVTLYCASLGFLMIGIVLMYVSYNQVLSVFFNSYQKVS
ncbi:hypothetical protein B0O44_104367 [Pedobacter nutrimenti]|uniref:Uncharacterized protein n=1 Tax=Pedobacter nutrimenti TaxID=1241337 RepID=A0A318UCS4_9SPHI|nr:hypothetical protein B0O44_104367 [Pedobacter nutrimenti]